MGYTKTNHFSNMLKINSLEAQGKIEKFGKRKGALGKTENTYKLIV